MAFEQGAHGSSERQERHCPHFQSHRVIYGALHSAGSLPKLIDIIPTPPHPPPPTPAPMLQMRRWLDSEHVTQNLKEKAPDLG